MSLKNFELGKELGKGAFGSVCIVKRKEDGKTYAMKRVKMSSLSPKEGEYALNEIRILASLSHLNIIDYKEAFFDEQSKTLNIVMEYADDGDIASKIKNNKKNHLLFQESTIWIWVIQILEGLKYLHDNKIMHRDLKSANIFLMKNGMLKLGDLNVSKLAKLGMAQTQAGTPYYCSPEIWLDKPYNYKSDIWSVGCIVYELATLRPPFQGISLTDLSKNIIKGVYDPIPTLYSRELTKIISKMLVVDPNYRMSTDQLLKDEIIIQKIMEYKSSIDFIGNKDERRAEMIKTIKLPKNLREINKALPKERYANQIRDIEIIENEEYETVKAGLYNGGSNKNSNANSKELQQQQLQNIQQVKDLEKLIKEKNTNEGYKPVIKNSNSNSNERQPINSNKNNYIDVFLQKDRDHHTSERNKDAYYYKHCINPFAKQEQNNDPCIPNKNDNAVIQPNQNNNCNNVRTENNKVEVERPVTSPNQPQNKNHQRRNPKNNNNNNGNKSPLINKRPKSSQHRPSKCLQDNEIRYSPLNGHKVKPPPAVKPIIVKPQINKNNNNNNCLMKENKGISPVHIIRKSPRDNNKNNNKDQIGYFRN